MGDSGINLMPFQYTKLGLGTLRTVNKILQFHDGLVRKFKRMKKLLMKVDNVVFLLDFVGFEMGEDKDVLLILSRPLLVTNDSEEDKGVSLILGCSFLAMSDSLPNVKNRHLILTDSC